MIRGYPVRTGGKERPNERMCSVDLGRSKRGSARQSKAGGKEPIGVSTKERASAGEYGLLVHGLPQRTALDVRRSQHGREFFRLPLCRYRIDENRGQPAVVLGVALLLEDLHALGVSEELTVALA